MPHLIQRYREKRSDDSQSPLISGPEKAGKKTTSSTGDLGTSTSNEEVIKTATSVVSPSNTPDNNSNTKRPASNIPVISSNESALRTPKDSKDAKHIHAKEKENAGEGSTTNTTSERIPVVHSNSSHVPPSATKSPPVTTKNHYQNQTPAPWYSPSPYPPHSHMGMGMYPPPAYHPPSHYMNSGMYYPHSPYPPPHVTPNAHNHHRMYSHPYGYHSNAPAATPKTAITPNHADENSTTSVSDAISSAHKNGRPNDAKEDVEKEPTAKRIKTESSATTESSPTAESDSIPQTAVSTPFHPQTPQPVMPRSLPPHPHHYYPYYPPHPHHPLAHPHPHAHTPHAPPPSYYTPRPQDHSSKSDESLKKCVRISIPKTECATNNTPIKQVKRTPAKSNPEFKMPSFQSLVNFPSNIHRRVNKTNTEVRCVMCGETRPSPNGKKEEGDKISNPQQQPQHFIPKQNKGLCTACDVAVWMIVEENVEIKWCKGCKNFRTWFDFGDKPCATKCGKCRDKQKEKYALKVGRTESGSAKKERNTHQGSYENRDGDRKGGMKRISSSTGGNDSGLSFLIAATNQVSKV